MEKVQIKIGDIKIGAGAPVSVQSMTNTKTDDIKGTLAQINELATAGCEIIRLAVLNKNCAEEIYKREHITYDKIFQDGHRVRWANEDGMIADWTDDTDQCLLILDSLVSHNGEVDEKDFAKRLQYWLIFYC